MGVLLVFFLLVVKVSRTTGNLDCYVSPPLTPHNHNCSSQCLGRGGRDPEVEALRRRKSSVWSPGWQSLLSWLGSQR